MNCQSRHTDHAPVSPHWSPVSIRIHRHLLPTLWFSVAVFAAIVLSIIILHIYSSVTTPPVTNDDHVVPMRIKRLMDRCHGVQVAYISWDNKIYFLRDGKKTPLLPSPPRTAPLSASKHRTVPRACQ